MKQKRRQVTTTVRMDQTARKRLESLCFGLNLKISDLVRMALMAKIPEWEREGIDLHLTANGPKQKCSSKMV